MRHKLVQITYSQLMQAIKKELQEGMARAEQVVNRQRVVAYWHIGRHIATYLSMEKPGSIPYGQELARIANGLDHSVNFVQRIIKFYKCYPDLPKAPPLSWNQYRILTGAPDHVRQKLEKRVIRENIGGDRLAILIRHMKDEHPKRIPTKRKYGPAKLPLVRGKLFVYPVIQIDKIGLDTHEVLVDCGFKVRKTIKTPGNIKIKGGYIVKSQKTGNSYALTTTYSDKKQLFTFKAVLAKVVDADTLVAHVDCGFGIWVSQRLRLRGINAPERKTLEGVEAKQYVVSRLEKCPFIVIKTYSPDKYGRRLADIFYSSGQSDLHALARKGTFLNQELLDKGFAVVYE